MHFLNLLSFGLLVGTSCALPEPESSRACKCTVNDRCWPTTREWTTLNKTVNGRLVATSLLGEPCHGTTFSAATCAELKTEWPQPVVYETTISGIMSPWWQNGSCDPFHPRDSPCLRGNYPVYSIPVQTASDIQAGLKFAQEQNIRLTVHNTGHDFMGRSSGASSLSLSTRGLNSTEFLPAYRGSSYAGPAIKFGSGLRAYEVYMFAHALGYRIVGGDCPTVGLAGGFLQGGGHSALTSLYGMAADQILEWEAVLPNGKLVTASPRRNPDLYWALSGGGGGTYAIATSVTVKAFKDIGPISGARLSITNSSSIPDTTFWDLVSKFHASLPELYSSGGGTEEHAIGAGKFFAISRITAPKWSEDQLRKWLSPITQQLDQYKANYTLEVTSHATYYDHYVFYQGPIPAGRYAVGILAHSRLVPRAVIASPSKNSALTDFLRDSTQDPSTAGFVYGCVGMDATAQNGSASNAVLPAWRSSAMSCAVFTSFPYDPATKPDKYDLQRTLMGTIAPKFRSITPDSGSYPNEANWDLDTWKEDFYGPTWDRLSSIKQQVDPRGVLYGLRNVGSEKWNLKDDGQLCRDGY